MRIAVVIPFYRADRWFAGTLASVVAQRRRADEIIVVNDGSVANDCRTLDALPPPVRVIHMDRNVGVGAARQAGCEASTAEAIAFLDADDWWEPGYLGMAEDMLKRFPDAPAVYGTIVKHDATGRATAFTDKPEFLEAREAIVRSHAYPSGFVARRQAIDRVGGWSRDRHLIEDWDFVVRLLDQCGAAPLMAEPLVHYRAGNHESVNAQHWAIVQRWRHTLVVDRLLVEKYFGAGSARRRLAQALSDRHHRAGGLRGLCYGVAGRALGSPLHLALTS